MEYKDTKSLNLDEEGQVSAGFYQNSRQISNKNVEQTANMPMLLYGAPPLLGDLNDIKSDIEDSLKSPRKTRCRVQNEEFDPKK